MRLGGLLAGLAMFGLGAASSAAAQDIADPTAACPVNDGRVFVNREHGIAARFPAGSRVCEHPLWGSGEPTGFLARLDSPAGRDIGPFGSGPTMDIAAAYYDFGPDPRCVDGPGARDADGRPLTFMGIPSRACIIDDGAFARQPMIVVSATVETSPAEDGFAGEAVTYTATLISSPETLESDKAMFETFLRDLALTPGGG